MITFIAYVIFYFEAWLVRSICFWSLLDSAGHRARVAMPLKAMDEAAIKEALALGADDLKWIFEECTISAHAQAILISGGMHTTRRLAHFASEETDFRSCLKHQY